jgi:antitoxin VapB
MHTAKIFQNGRSQAVRLPKAFRMEGKEVKISKQGNKIILEPIEVSWTSWFNTLNEFSNDFMADGREQPKCQERDWSDLE